MDAVVDVTSFIRDKKTIFPRIGVTTLEKFQSRAKLLTDPDARPLVTASITLPHAETELFFDIETDPMRDLCDLHGFVKRNNGDNSTEQFHALCSE